MDKDLKIQELQNIIDNMYIAAYYNNDIKTFKRIGIGFVSVPVLGITHKRYIPMESEYWTIDEKGLTFKPLENE